MMTRDRRHLPHAPAAHGHGERGAGQPVRERPQQRAGDSGSGGTETFYWYDPKDPAIFSADGLRLAALIQQNLVEALDSIDRGDQETCHQSVGVGEQLHDGGADGGRLHGQRGGVGEPEDPRLPEDGCPGHRRRDPRVPRVVDHGIHF